MTRNEELAPLGIIHNRTAAMVHHARKRDRGQQIDHGVPRPKCPDCDTQLHVTYIRLGKENRRELQPVGLYCLHCRQLFRGVRDAILDL